MLVSIKTDKHSKLFLEMKSIKHLELILVHEITKGKKTAIVRLYIKFTINLQFSYLLRRPHQSS